MDYEWIDKTIFKKLDKKIKKTRKSMSKWKWTKKPLARNENLIQTKN